MILSQMPLHYTAPTFPYIVPLRLVLLTAWPLFLDFTVRTFLAYTFISLSPLLSKLLTTS